ncbi:MAG: HlyC/CorC family transporter [Caldilinea sp. CFX5]|nr:HlyC/CorC family transporter [Caldilinea sp. CFX5]
MNNLSLEILIVLLLIVANGVFALSEAAIVAVRKARLQQRAQEGDHDAQIALDLADNPSRFLSTVQIGITLIGIVAGAFGGATISEKLAAYLAPLPYIGAYADSISFGLVVLVITYLSLIIGELVPKSIALQNPEQIATLVAAPMRRLSVIAGPFVTFLSYSTDFLLRLMGIQTNNEPPVTEEEIRVMIEQGTESGVFAAAEQDMVERIFRFGDRAVSSLMTRRPDIVWLDLEDPLEKNLGILTSRVYSRFPVCRGSLDEVVGVVRAKDLLNQHIEGKPFDLAGAVQLPVFVPATLPAIRLLERLRQERTHIVLVIDEHGSIEGLVTLNDILGAIVGDLPAVDESDEPYAVQREDGSWFLDGMLPIDDFKALLDLDKLPDEESGNFETLSGFVIMQMGRLPKVGEAFDAMNMRFEVADMDGYRIDKVLVAPTVKAAEREES